jgi:Holliday junction resolvase RusA-like endonuclease
MIRSMDSDKREPCVRPPQAGSNPASSPFIPFTLALTGQLPSGKNQVQLLWRNGKIQRYPNKVFTNWRAKAALELLEQKRPQVALSAPISLSCDYWPGNRIVRDVSGQLDAIFSLLVYAHIVKDDGLVYSVLWRRHAVCRFPKVVMELEAWHE